MLLRNKIGKRLSIHLFLKLILPPLGRAGVGISFFEQPFLKLTLPPLGRVGVGISRFVHPFLKLSLPPLGRVGVGISRFEQPFLKLTLPPLGRAGVGIRLFGLSLSSPFHTDLPCFRFVHSPYVPTSCISLGHKWD